MYATIEELWPSIVTDMERGISVATLQQQVKDTAQIFIETSADPDHDPAVVTLRKAYKRLMILSAEKQAERAISDVAAMPIVQKDAALRAAAPAATLEHNTPNGVYTVVMADGDYVTLRIKDDFRQDAPAGSQMAQYLSGPDNSNDYTGFAFVVGNRGFVWKKFRSGNSRLITALNVLLQGDFVEHGMAYAMRSGNCWHCGRPLTVPASLHRGVGPICAEKLGM